MENKNYIKLLNEVKKQVISSNIKAVKSVNRELINMYWNIGELILERQNQFGWGKSIVTQLSKDLQKEFAKGKGFSSQNLWFMRQMVNEYSSANLLQPVRDLQIFRQFIEIKEFADNKIGSKNSVILFLKQLVTEIPWSHNIQIMTKIKNINERIFYLQATAGYGWSRNILLNQIKSNAYQRSLTENKQNNFAQTLPKHLAEQTSEAIKSSYYLDFLGVTSPISEQVLESKMIENIRDLLIELGYGFAYLGNQYKISLGNNNYFIDLLFYHRNLKCLVAIELKVGKFKPEYAGKLNFYLEVLDKTERLEHENQPIGILLCAEKDNIEVEYSLRTSNKPIGVAKYERIKELPKEKWKIRVR